MEVVTVSPRFQVVIPRAVRQSLGLKARQKIQVTHVGMGFRLLPQEKMAV